MGWDSVSAIIAASPVTALSAASANSSRNIYLQLQEAYRRMHGEQVASETVAKCVLDAT